MADTKLQEYTGDVIPLQEYTGDVVPFSQTSDNLKTPDFASPQLRGLLKGMSPASRREASKGFVSGLGQVATGIGELVPGQIGEKSAEYTKKLQEVGSPATQELGKALPYLFPMGEALGGARLGVGALEGVLAGAAAPTGTTDPTERYKEKAINAALSGALVGAGELSSAAVQKFVGLLKGSKSSAEIDKLVNDLKQGKLQESLMPGRQITPQEAKAVEAQLLTAPTHDQTGANMLQDVQKNIGGLRKQREQVAEKSYGLADQSMAAQQDAGDVWQESPSGKSFIKNLQSRLDTTEETKETAGVRDQIRGLIRDLKGEPKAPPETPILGPSGEPLAPTGPTVGYSRPKVIREVLRKLRDAAAGYPEEGYAAIGQQRAGALADELSQSIAGWNPTLKAADDAYKAQSKLLYPSQTKRGKAALAGEKFDINELAADPSTIPRKFFQSKQGVEQLTDLLGGNKDLVEKHATDYVMRELANVSPENAADWLQKNRGWLFYDTLPKTYEAAAKLAYQRESGALVQPFTNLISNLEKGAVKVEDLPSQIRTILQSPKVTEKVARKISNQLDDIEKMQNKEERARKYYDLIKNSLIVLGVASAGVPYAKSAISGIPAALGFGD